MHPTDIGFELTDHPDRDEIRFLEDRVDAFNIERTGITDARLLAITARDAGGRIVAGLYGWTWGGCGEIRTLWVDEQARGQRLGTQLMLVAESEARDRGARQLVLSTHSFQAPRFYQRLGFVIVGQIDDYPEGHTSIYLRKPLEPMPQAGRII